MGTPYFGSLKVFGNQDISNIVSEAYERLSLVKGKQSHFRIDEIKTVFMGSASLDSWQNIGCRDLVLEHFRKNPTNAGMQFEIFFSTDSGYPDYFAAYLISHLRKIDTNVKIILQCVSDGGEKVNETFTFKK